ncbi:MAG: hypothetical protein OJF49_001747 [Ktedonobacterales bacterium]|jgi:hypothetical protein|nr:MAG: hypothetical protein OJF49_001747 [Ktedonobacterales bacterium]
MMAQPSKFSFVDEGEALRRLGIDRDLLLSLVAAKRLRAFQGVGKGNFYRVRDIEALYAELHAGEDQPAPADDDATVASGRKVFDPAYKVHVRLQADLKWYDLEDDDLRAWVREMHADGYTRQRTNITMVMAKLQRLIDLMDEAAASWQTLPAPPAPDRAPALQGRELPTSPATPSKPQRQPLQMLPSAPTSAPATPPASPDPTPPSEKPKRRSLPMLGQPPQEN